MDPRKVQNEALIGALFIILSSVLLFYVAFAEGSFNPLLKVDDTAETSDLVQTAQYQHAVSVEAGAELFNSACAECHNPDGKGLLGAPLNDPHLFDLSPDGRLAEVGWGGTLRDFLIATISAGRPISTRPEWPGKQNGSYAMPAWSTEYGGPLRPDQIRNLADFILNFEAEATGKVVVTREFAELSLPPEEQGKRLFTQMTCNACHTIDGLSLGQVGPNLTLIATTAATRVEGLTAEEYIRQSILEPSLFIVPDCPLAACPTPSPMEPLNFAAKLSEEQLNNLVIYLLTLVSP